MAVAPFTQGPSQKVPNIIDATVTTHFTTIQLNLKKPQSVSNEYSNPVIREPKAAGMTTKSSSSFIEALKHKVGFNFFKGCLDKRITQHCLLLSFYL